MAKERDNTWLQLQICPDIWRQKEDKGPLLECPEKAECRLIYAHPNKNVLDQSLVSGYVNYTIYDNLSNNQNYLLPIQGPLEDDNICI